MSVEVLLKNVFTGTGEGPHWDEDTHTLFFIDNLGQKVFSWNYRTKEVQMIQLEKVLGFIIPRAKGGHVIGYGKTISAIDLNSKKVSVITEVDQAVDTRMNDGKCDARGRLWFGTMGADRLPEMPEKEQGSLYCLDTDGTVKKHKEKVTISNGLAWSSDNKRMYYIDSIPGKVYGMDYDIETGTFTNEKVTIDFEAIGTLGLPDGMTIDREDKIWVACYAGAKVVRFDSDTGKQLQCIDFPAKRITSCCFGGPNYDELFVTCGCSGASDQELKDLPLSGSLFRVAGLGVKGSKPNIFQG
ncbi:regucalcin-like [Mytilus trossulus]|uniref:regucalcin-like n=1 Tax=Mytilus trossulus TaxID=6551 RepID=UPI0030046C51